jgi:diaminopimelate decarboxylase
MPEPTVFNWEDSITADQAAQVIALAIKQDLIGNRPALLLHNMTMLSQKIKHLHSYFPPQTLHALAIKSNPLVAVLQFAVAYGMGLEAASIEEVELARAANCPAERIVYDSPAKTRDEIAKALAWGVTINADNFEELERIDNILAESPNTSSLIGLRINPQIGHGSISILSVSGQYSKFGVPITERRAEITAAFLRFTWLRGLHMHIGSQGIVKEQIAEATALIFQLRDEIHAKLGEARIISIDIGGGLPWRYRPDEPVTTPQDLAKILAKSVPQAWQDNIRLVTEYGRAIQAGCGFAASRVEYLKTDSVRRTAVIHFGADLMMRKVYHPNDWHHQISVLDCDANLKTGNEELHTIVGPLCFGGDILAENVKLPRIEEGDWIVLHDTGAYTLSLWSRHCNRGLPPVLGYITEPLQLNVLFPGETSKDIVRFWSNPDLKTASREIKL